MKLNGKIVKKSDEKFYFDDENKKKNLQHEGKIESEKGKNYTFKYGQLRFNIFLLQLGMDVSFHLTTDKDGNKKVTNVEKNPTDFGFLSSYNERYRRGLFKTFEKDKVEFFNNNVREEDEPLFGSLYVFDIITTLRKKYDNSNYFIGENKNYDIFEVGQIRNGTVKNITDFGAFIDIGHPTDDGLLWNKEIVWTTDKNPNVSELLIIGDKIDVLITKVFQDSSRTKIDLSRKALIKPPDEIEKVHRAYNIFRLDKMRPKIINTLVSEIANREDVLPEAKILAITIIKNNPDLYKRHRNTTLPVLYEFCKKELIYHIDGEKFNMAFYLLQEYATYDISILEMIDKFPENYLSKLNSIDINLEDQSTDEDLEAFLFSLKHKCSVTIAKEYIELSENIFNERNMELISILRDKIGIKPSLQLDEGNYD